MGKYNGSLIKNYHFDSLSKVYDINIYEGKISNVINQVQHPNTINESTYKAIKSHLLLEQKSFENIACVPENKGDDHNGYKLHIKEPKLENIEIKDVLKESDKTYGTITCKVTGYLIDYVLEEDQIEIEVCDKCNEPLEDCSCKSHLALQDIPKIGEEELTYQRTKWGIDYSWSGCFAAIGLILLVLFALSFGLPGFIVLIILGIFYGVWKFSGNTNITNRIFSWIGYSIIGLFFLGVLFTIVNECSDKNYQVNPIEYKSNNRYTPYKNSDQRNVIKSEKNSTAEKPKIKSEEEKIINSIRKPISKTIISKSVYICNGKYSKRYHLSPYCRGLSNCKSTISSISLNNAKERGRSLCGWED